MKAKLNIRKIVLPVVLLIAPCVNSVSWCNPALSGFYPGDADDGSLRHLTMLMTGSEQRVAGQTIRVDVYKWALPVSTALVPVARSETGRCPTASIDSLPFVRWELSERGWAKLETN